MAAQDQAMDLQMDSKELYLEEVFTDRRVGSIMRLTPVDGEGKPDPAKPVIYVGQTQILTPAGTLPLSFEIQAGSLADAAAKFGDAAKRAVDDTMERLKQLRREAASSLIIPEAGGGGGGFGGPGPAPGGGKIQFR